MQIYGLDVSQHQGQVDWAKVAGSGKRFVMIRMGWCGYSGAITWDQRFEANMTGAAQAGLEVGVYLYSYADSPESARAAAASVLEKLRGCRVTYPVALDMEDRMYWNLGKAANSAIASAFLDAVQRGGYYTQLYTYTSFSLTYLDMTKLRAYDLWLADYRSSVGYTGSYGMWQYTGSGKAEGVSTAADLDVAYKDYAALIRGAGLNHLDGESGDCSDEVVRLRAQLTAALLRAQNAEAALESRAKL